MIRHREEEFPKKLGEVTLADPTGTGRLDTYFAKKSIDAYRAKLAAHEQKRLEHFARYGIRSVKIFTDEEVVGKLIRLFV